MGLSQNSDRTEIVKAWTSALRSGKYPQGRGFLRKSDGFCVMGILCSLAVETSVIPPPVIIDRKNKIYAFDESVTVLPKKVFEWAGLWSGFGSYYGSDLVLDNDNGKTLKEMADIIESHPELFVSDDTSLLVCRPRPS